jgi:hypothetical protein
VGVLYPKRKGDSPTLCIILMDPLALALNRARFDCVRITSGKYADCFGICFDNHTKHSARKCQVYVADRVVKVDSSALNSFAGYGMSRVLLLSEVNIYCDSHLLQSLCKFFLVVPDEFWEEQYFNNGTARKGPRSRAGGACGEDPFGSSCLRPST